MVEPVPVARQTQGPCYPFSRANLAEIKGTYGEARVGVGITSGDWFAEHWVNATTSTWSITVRNARGFGCLVGAGKGWSSAKPSAKGSET